MTSAWTFRNRPVARRALDPTSRWLLRRLARVYGFSLMPPMPPDPRETAARAQAVRRVLTYARHAPRPIIGLAPEGRDSADGSLLWPAAGAGRFMLQLAALGLEIAPVGAFEAEGAFCLRFGPRYRLNVPASLSADERDREASRVVMRCIAALLPERFRGEFA
jgi:hypothetical protein